MSQNADKIYWKIGLFSIFLISIGFMGIGDKFVLLLLILNCLMQFRLSKKLFIDIEAILLFTGMLSYSICGRLEAVWIIKCTLLPTLFYIFGTSILISQSKTDCGYRTKAIIIILSLGMLIESILNALRWSPEYGRHWPEFWSGRNLPATQHVFFNLLICGLFFYGIYYWKKQRLLNSILILGGIWCLWFSLITGSRLLIMIFALVSAANIILYFYLNRHKGSSRKYLYILTLCLLATVIVGSTLYIFNIGGFYDYLHSYMWTRDGGILHNIRFQAQFSALKQIFQYPFGGNQMDLAGLNFTHNVWLDMANRSGLLPFVLNAIYTFITFYNLLKLIRTQTIDHEIKYLLSSSWFTFFLFYMVEAALEANIMYWALWALIGGLIKGVLKNHNN